MRADAEVRFAPTNGHRQRRAVGPLSAKSRLMHRVLIRSPHQRERAPNSFGQSNAKLLIEGLRKAGLPE